MKAITLHQPWATLVAIGAKQIETRSWPTHYRGQIAIHAGKTREPLEYHQRQMTLAKKNGLAYQPFEMALVAAIQKAGIDKWSELPFGAVIATAHLADCVSTSKLKLTMTERLFGNFAVGRYGWLLVDIQMLPEPIPARGYQGLWDWNPVEI